MHPLEEALTKAFAGQRASSLLVYKSIARRYVAHTQAHGTAPQSLRGFFGALSVRTRKRYFEVLGRLYEYALTAGTVQSNPLEGLESDFAFEEPRDVTPPLTPAEVDRFLVALGAASGWKQIRDRALCGLLLETGLRLGELLRLQPGDVQTVEDQLRITAGTRAKRRTLVVSEPARTWLAAWIETRAALCPKAKLLFIATKEADPLVASTVYRRVGAVFKQAQIERASGKGPQALRSTFAMRQLEVGRATSVIGARLGHVRIESTQALVDELTRVVR